MAETRGPYTTGSQLTSAAHGLAEQVETLSRVELGGADEPSIRAAMATVNTQVRRLQAQLAGFASELTRRQAARLNPTDPDDLRTRQRAEADTQRELADRLQMTPSEAKRTTKVGRDLDRRTTHGKRALMDGEITVEHATLLSRTLRDLSHVDERDRLEATLLEAARNQNLTEFGKTCRRLKARHAPEKAQKDLERLRHRRYGNMRYDEHGALHIRGGGWVGVEAEIVATAFEAFRTKDHPDRPRSTDQRGADAIFETFKHALDHKDTTEHGNRPHILVEVTWSDLLSDNGVAETTYTGPLPVSEIRRLLDDSSITRLVTGPDSQILDVGRARRSLPAPAWRALLKRDGGCTLDGCNAPPNRCQGAHMDRRWIQGAGTSVAEQALACWRCHKTIDDLDLTGRLVDGHVVWFRPDGRRYERHPHPVTLQRNRGRPPDRPSG